MATDLSIQEILDALWPVITQRIADRASAAVDLLEEMLRAEGGIRRHDHELRAGDRVLNGDRDLLARVSKATGLGLSLYLGNRRVASFSTLMAGASADLGGYADAQLVETVLRKGEAYRGTLVVDGRRHIVASRPLLAGGGGTEEYGAIGMIEAFQDVEGLLSTLSSSLEERLQTSERSATEQQADRMEAVMVFIDDVARRLQLLALNGNILAAQAGDHGRAFRVVCRELSSLADQAKGAVAEVRSLTDEMGLRPDEIEPEARVSSDASVPATAHASGSGTNTEAPS
ncbi:MAG: methyl-accepting chemotaxis protein [Myxococcota bacterium]